jgi:hypothetical protein
MLCFGQAVGLLPEGATGVAPAAPTISPQPTIGSFALSLTSCHLQGFTVLQAVATGIALGDQMEPQMQQDRNGEDNMLHQESRVTQR